MKMVMRIIFLVICSHPSLQRVQNTPKMKILPKVPSSPSSSSSSSSSSLPSSSPSSSSGVHLFQSFQLFNHRDPPLPKVPMPNGGPPPFRLEQQQIPQSANDISTFNTLNRKCSNIKLEMKQHAKSLHSPQGQSQSQKVFGSHLPSTQRSFPSMPHLCPQCLRCR